MLEHFPSPIVSAVLFIDRTDRSASLSSVSQKTVSREPPNLLTFYFPNIEEIGLNVVVFQLQDIINCGMQKKINK